MSRNIMVVAAAIVLLVLGAAPAFAAGTTEQGTAGADEQPLVTITRNYRGWDPSRIDWDYVAENDVILRHIEETFNVKVEMPFTAGDYQVVVAGMASGDIGDVIDTWVGHPSNPVAQWRDWIKDGLIVDLKEIVDANPGRYPVLEILFDDPVYRLYNLKQNGDLDAYYLVHPGWATRRPIGSIAFNGYLLGELGLDVPETYDELVHAMRRAKQELGVSGYGWPTYGGTQFSYMARHFFQPQGAEIDGFWMDADGNWFDAAIDPGNQAIWEEVQTLAEEGLFHPRWLTGELWDYMDDLVAGKHLAGSFKGPNPSQYLYFWDRFKQAHPEANMEEHMPQMLHPLRGPGGHATTYQVPFAVRRGNFIPVYSEDPERALDVLHYTLTEEFQYMRWFGVKGVHYTRDDRSDFDLAKLFDTMKGYFYMGKTVDDVDPMRVMYEPFYNTTHYNAGIVPYETYGSFYDAHLNHIDMRWERSRDFYAAQGNTVEVWENFRSEGWEALPQWLDFISLSDEAAQIQSALSDVKIKWWVDFLLGNKDVATEWDAFVQAYKERGADQLLAEWEQKANQARTQWEAVVGP